MTEHTADTALHVENLSMRFGGIQAVEDVSFSVRRNEILALIGPNGAGKTTLFNCITGIYRPSGGAIHAVRPDGKAKTLNGLKPNHITEWGVVRTFQNIRLFANMTALENVMVGRHCRTQTGIFGAVFRPPMTRQEERHIVQDSRRLLRRFGLAARADEYAGELPYAMQRRLEMARTLAAEPFLLLLDEPAAGMNPRETLDLENLLREVREEYNLSLLLIEHDMRLVMRISDRIVVVDHGVKLAEGDAESIGNNPDVIRAYLGEEV